MLEFFKVQNPSQIKELLKNYNPLQDTWVVSDLKSKQEIQNESLLKYGYYTDDAILRVSDFWRLWIRRLEPTLQVVSSDFIKSLTQNFIDLYGDKLEISESEVSTLNKAVQEFAPLLLHPSSEDVLEEWLSSQETEKKWQRWYQLAKVCINYIVNEKKVIDAKWSAAYLQSLDLNLISWPRKMYVDLGSELTTIEMGLFKHISQKQDVVLITPDPEWKDKFPFLLNTYKENFGYGQVREPSDKAKSYNLRPEQLVRVSTQLAEVKWAVSEVRSYLDSGVALNEIALISSDIEKYWPVLQFYLDEEGVAYKKDTVAQFNSLGDVQNLLAQLKSLSQDVSWDSLEKSFFSKEAQVQFKYEKFKALFYQIYDQDDLARDTLVKNLFFQKIDLSGAISRDEFLAFVVKTWLKMPESNKKSEIFESLFKDLLAQSLNEKMKLKLWINFLKSRLSHKEITIKRGLSEGLYVLPLMSAQMIDVSHRIYLGLNDEFFHRRQNTLMSISDAQQLRSQFDLAVENAEESYLDFNLRWQVLACNENTRLLSSHLSFSAEPLNSSLFFIENSPQSEVLSPHKTRADELQHQWAYSDEDLKQLDSDISLVRLQQDLKGYSQKIKSEVFRSLSVSDLENYAQCGFKLLAAKGFRLQDLPQIAIDLDPRQKGSLSHALFEFCIKLIAKNEFDLQKVSDFLDQKRQDLQIYVAQDMHWNLQKNKFLILAQKFNSFEAERVKKFDVSAEKALELYFDLETQAFTLQKVQDSFLFKIRIDRIDVRKDKKYAVIYDYKSSAYQVSNHDKWLSDLQLQMLLYMLAAESSGEVESPVKAALYYQHKSFDIKKGLIDEEIALSDFGFSKRNKSLISEDEAVELKKQFIELVNVILKKLSEDIFATEPIKYEICDECDWRKLCRAPHLM